MRALVAVVDDDESAREALPDLLSQLGFAVRAFSSGEEFLASEVLETAECLLLDIAMPGMTGPDVQRELLLRQRCIPIVFITAHGDEDVRRRLLEGGAVSCLFKPFGQAELLDAVHMALGVRS
jgi:FixJ family two-component response regulator